MQDVSSFCVAVVRRPEEEQGTGRRRIIKDMFQSGIPILEIAIIGINALVLFYFNRVVEGGVVGPQVELDQ